MYKHLKILRLKLDNQEEIHQIPSHMLQNKQSQGLRTRSPSDKGQGDPSSKCVFDIETPE